jgi:hypothetical protein
LQANCSNPEDIMNGHKWMVRLVVALSLITGSASAALAQTWSEITPASGAAPTPRTLASAVFDTRNRQMVIFGGQGAAGPLNDVWAFDLDAHTWTDLTPASGAVPAPRFTPASVYDAVSHRMLTWSGQGTGAVFFNDVWSFDLTTHTWAQQFPAGGPPNIRYGVAAVFDPVGRDLVTFAGFTNLGRFHDVWRFGADAVTWTDVSPATGPIERCLHTASYDARNHRMILYGGQNGGPLGDTWAFDLTSNTWADLTPATRPGGRFFTSSVYDSSNHRVTVFGGMTSGGKTNEAWLFDLTANAWEQIVPGGTAPSARDGSAAIHDGALDRMVIFGGQDTVRRNDVWVLEDLSTVGVFDAPLSRSVTLHPNAPNPFHPSTRIAFDLAHGAHVRVHIYDARGRFVRMLVDGFRQAGPNAVIWDGLDDRGVSASAGIYVCQVVSGGTSATRKLVRI